MNCLWQLFHLKNYFYGGPAVDQFRIDKSSKQKKNPGKLVSQTPVVLIFSSGFCTPDAKQHTPPPVLMAQESWMLTRAKI